MEQEANEELEEYAYVLDFLPTGKSSSLHSEPIAQLVGEGKFTLLEVVTKTTDIKIGERVYIGKGDRDKVLQIKSRITYNDLTEPAKNELPIAVANIIRQNESRFVRIFNTAGPLNIRLHALELLPGIGKKHLEAIIAAREEKEFESFDDLTKRVPLLQDPVKLLTERVIEELKGGSRFYILTRPYKT
ncbi:MAG: DUF655 domain-containing protein [Candidatus Micrarchaeia archaeon]